MTIENPLNWPQVNMEVVSPRWWDEVMKASAPYQAYFSDELNNTEDFTIRAIVCIIVTRDREIVDWFMAESVQKDRVMIVHDLLHDTDEGKKQQGREELVKLINDYTEEVQGSSKET